MNFLFRLTTSYSKCNILASEEQMKTRVKNFGIRNLKNFGIRNPTFGIRNPRCGIRNPRLAWIPLHGATTFFKNYFANRQVFSTVSSWTF